MTGRLHPRRTAVLVRAVTGAAIAALIVLIVWVDVATGVWQDTVILSGIAAGLLTFALTALFLERWMARSAHRRWLPVTRLALSDLLHALADEEASEISRGRIVPRTLEVPRPLEPATAQGLLTAVVAERDELTRVLARWSGFLAASADVQNLMRHLARIAQQLDAIRDGVLDWERDEDPNRAEDQLNRDVARFHTAVGSAVDELNTLLGPGGD